MANNDNIKPAPHPGVAATAIALMALMVAGAADLVGLIEPFDTTVSTWVYGFGLDGPADHLQRWQVWSWTAIITFGLTQALLHVEKNWRRGLLFGLVTVVTCGWIPVLALAGKEIPLGVPLTALLWGGGGSIIYAVRHRELM